MRLTYSELTANARIASLRVGDRLGHLAVTIFDADHATFAGSSPSILRREIFLGAGRVDNQKMSLL